MCHIAFRRAETVDLPAIIALIADDQLGQIRENPALPLDKRYLEAYQTIRDDPNQVMAVVEDQTANQIIGCLQITFIPGLTRFGMWRAQIEGVRIARHRRGEGLGEKTFAWAIDLCRSRGCGLVQLTTDKRRNDAHRFYEKLGFVASHEGMKLSLALAE